MHIDAISHPIGNTQASKVRYEYLRAICMRSHNQLVKKGSGLKHKPVPLWACLVLIVLMKKTQRRKLLVQYERPLQSLNQSARNGESKKCRSDVFPENKDKQRKDPRKNYFMHNERRKFCKKDFAMWLLCICIWEREKESEGERDEGGEINREDMCFTS